MSESNIERDNMNAFLKLLSKKNEEDEVQPSKKARFFISKGISMPRVEMVLHTVDELPSELEGRTDIIDNLESLSKKVLSLERENLELRGKVAELFHITSTLSENVLTLRERMKQIQIQSLDSQSKENMRLIAQIYDLPEMSESNTGKDILNKMQGMFDEYSSTTEDSESLVRSIRDED